jgi:AraC-like DNA-binding protein
VWPVSGTALLRAAVRRLAQALREGDVEELTRAGALVDVLVAERPARAVAVLEALLLADDDRLPPAVRAHLAAAARDLEADGDGGAARRRLAALWRTVARSDDARPVPLTTVLEEYLATHLDARARLGDLARKLGYSPSHVSTLIRRATGRPFVVLRRRLRFERACALLRAGTSVKEAALAAGFDDPAYFSRAFKRRVGLSPSAWRGEVGRSPAAPDDPLPRVVGDEIREKPLMAARKPVPRTAKSTFRAKAKPPMGSRHPPKLPANAAEAAAIERLRAICLALPEVTEKIAWGEPTWRAGKIFAQMDTHHHGAAHVAVWLPARPGVQEGLIEEDPEHFFRPPYVGHKGWIGIRIDRKPDWKIVADLVADAYREVAPSHLVARLDAQRPARKRGWQASWIGRDD